MTSTHEAGRREGRYIPAPVEPTEAMIAAGEAAFRHYCFRHINGAIPTYDAMLAAAPTPEPVGGLEPPGCPTPGACSCPGGEAELARRLGEVQAALTAAEARANAAEERGRRRVAEAEREWREKAAQIVEGDLTKVEVDRFSCNGLLCRNPAGHDTFISTVRVSELLRRHSAAIRALPDAPSDGGADAP